VEPFLPPLLVKLGRVKAAFEAARVWRSFPAVLSYQSQFLPKYWQLRRLANNGFFLGRKWNFHAKSLLRGTFESSSILAQIARTIFWQFVFALAAVFALCVVERLGEKHYWPIISHSLTPEAQLNFFATLLQVSGGFLALYFTALSVVISAAYVRTPGQIRYLVTQEQVGSLYFRTLAQFVGVLTIMLLALTLNIHIGILNTFFASILCLFGAFGFVVLGIRILHYFDPIALAPHISRLISRAVHTVTPAGFQWRDPSFQRHHQQHAQNLLSVFADLVTIAAQKENLTTKGLLELGKALLVLTNAYAVEKRKIPTSSLWFRKRHRHKNWLLSSYHEVGIALETSTIPQPENEPDLLWFETEIAEILRRICKELADRGDTDAMGSLASRLIDTMMTLGSLMAVEEFVKILDAVGPYFSKQVGSKISDLGLSNSPELHESLVLIEGYSCSFINAALGLSRGVATLSVENFGKQFASVNWLSAGDLYKRTSVPRKMLEEFEWVRERLDFEFRSEGRILTPDWFCKEPPARGYVRFLMDSAQLLVKKFEYIFGLEAQRLTAEKKYVLLAQLVQRGLECSDKLCRTLRELQSACEQFCKLNRSKEWEWPTLDWAVVEKGVITVRELLIGSLAKAAPFLAIVDGENLPDYFGQAYSVVADECLTAIIRGNENRFSTLFPSLFATSLLAFDKLREKFLSDSRNIRLAAGPFLDLLALSGYAAIFSALDNKSFDAVATKSWDAYFTKIADPKHATDIITLMCLIVEPDSRWSSRDYLRMGWKRAVEGVLLERNIMSDRMGDYFGNAGRRVSRHSSPLVRAFSRGGRPLFTEPEHVFLSLYALKRPEASAVEHPPMVEDFERSLQREEKGKGDDEEAD